MDPEQAAALLETLEAIAASLQHVRSLAILILAAVVSLWGDLMLRVGRACWMDVKRRREAKALVDIVPVSQSQREPYRTAGRPGTIGVRPPERRRRRDPV